MTDSRMDIQQILETYGERDVEGRTQDVRSFAAGIRVRAAHRRRVREIRRSGSAVLTSVLLLVLTLNGVDFLVPSSMKDATALFRSTRNTAQVLNDADSAIASLEQSSFDDQVSGLFSYLNSDLPEDPVENLAKYDDEVINSALERLKAIDLNVSDQDTRSSDDPMEG